MADGSHRFNFPPPQLSRLRPREIVVDLFAGGGGASEALKQALGIDPALAYNHDEWAIGMHAANHPLTIHHREDIWHADPVADVAGRPVGWFHFSPDCTHFSQAKGGQPRSHKIRALAWVGVKWIGQLQQVGLAPRLVSMENVWQMLSWCPLVAKRDKATGRVIKMDGTVAAVGERVPVQMQQLVPDKKRLGQTWQRFVRVLRSFGYVVQWRKLVASDYGAGTSRERLFLLARRDGLPIQWPAATHGKAPGLLPVVTAADCLDFTIPCPSIFTRKRPLAEATMRRIAKGVSRHVLQAAEPFFLTEFANASNGRTWSAREPLRTQCAGVKGGHFAVVAPTLVQTGYGEREGQAPRALDIRAPLGTVVAGGVKHALVSAFLEQANGGRYQGGGRDLREPMSTITARGSQQQLVEASLAQLSPDQEQGALRVAAFLIRYYGEGGQWGTLREPMATVTTKDRLALVTVTIQGTPYVIVDIGLRMLRPTELYRAQGFPPDYVIDRTADGRPISGTHAVRMVGNSVSPPPLHALAVANLDRAAEPLRAAA
jgi:DNA (cytosine-5)-methyltransferase 1